MRNWIVYIGAGLLWLSGCASDTTEKPAELVDFEPEATINTVWSKDVGSGTGENGVVLQPWYSGTTVFVANDDGKILALDKTTGRKKWKVNTGQVLTAGVGGGDSMIFVSSAEGQLSAYWQRNGEQVWEVDLDTEMLAPVAAERGVVVVRTTDGLLTALSSANGEKLWTYRFEVPSLSLRGTATPVLFQGGVLCGSDDGRLAVLRQDTGQLLWDVPVAVSSGSSELARVIDVDIPVVIDGRVLFAAAYQGRVVAISTNNGKVLWARDKSVYLPMALDDYMLYVVDSRTFISGLNRYTGSTVWTQEELRARPASGVAVYKDFVVIGDFEGYLHVLDASDGRMVARKDMGSRINVQPHVDGDLLFIIDQSGEMSALTIERIAREN